MHLLLRNAFRIILAMSMLSPEVADAVSRARLAAALAVAEYPDTLRWSLRERSRTSRLAATSALAQGLAWPVSRAARLTGAVADQVWDARCDADPVFVSAEREARAAIGDALGRAAPIAADAIDQETDVPDDAVVALRPPNQAILDWTRAYVRRGVSIDDLADFFSVSHEALAAALENKQ